MIAKPSRPARQAKRAALAAARAQGCTCDVKVVVQPPNGVGGLHDITLRHDSWCPLLRVMEERSPGPARSQVVLWRQDGGES